MLIKFYYDQLARNHPPMLEVPVLQPS